jgi:hypothetical protein
MRFPESGLPGHGFSCGARCFAVIPGSYLLFLLDIDSAAALFSQ